MYPGAHVCSSVQNLAPFRGIWGEKFDPFFRGTLIRKYTHFQAKRGLFHAYSMSLDMKVRIKHNSSGKYTRGLADVNTRLLHYWQNGTKIKFNVTFSPNNTPKRGSRDSSIRVSEAPLFLVFVINMPTKHIYPPDKIRQYKKSLFRVDRNNIQHKRQSLLNRH